jgi:hypothetical protein
MSVNIAGSWKLLAWRRLEGDTVVYPFGEDAIGILIYAEDGSMAVQMTAADRPTISTTDALGGDAEQRAAAYSTCLAYFGTWELKDNQVIHHVEASLFPNWSGTVQTRPFTCDGQELILRTPPQSSSKGVVVNEMSWTRQVAHPDG